MKECLEIDVVTLKKVISIVYNGVPRNKLIRQIGKEKKTADINSHSPTFLELEKQQKSSTEIWYSVTVPSTVEVHWKPIPCNENLITLHPHSHKENHIY